MGTVDSWHMPQLQRMYFFTNSVFFSAECEHVCFLRKLRHIEKNMQATQSFVFSTFVLCLFHHLQRQQLTSLNGFDV